jgi:predicted nucleotidyltransferase
MIDQHHQLAVVHMHAVLDPGTARGRPHAWIDRQSALSSSPQDLCLLLEKNSPAVSELGSWCHLGP